MGVCRAETILAHRRVACGNPEGHAGPHGWEGLSLRAVEQMSNAGSLTEGDVLVIANDSDLKRKAMHEKIEAQLQGPFETYVMWHGIADTLAAITRLTRNPEYIEPIKEAERKVRAASPHVDPKPIALGPSQNSE